MKKRKIIELKNVCKYYQMGNTIVKAIDGINISVHEGEFVSIMGPSGSGKSTSMNLIGSMDMPTKGKIFLDGKNISNFGESDLAQIRGKKIGFIFQQFNLIPNLNARENVMLPMMFQGKSENERFEKAGGLLSLVGLKERGNHYPGQLSGGERQRVAIARALANDPEVILADEPTGNLDTKTGDIVIDFLNKLNNDGKTIVLITHDKEKAVKNSGKIYWLKDGKIEKITKKEKGKWKQIKEQ